MQYANEHEQPGALVDSGANTGLQGSDMRLLLHQEEYGSVSVIGPSGSNDANTGNLPLVHVVE